MADHQRDSLLFLALFSCLVCSSYSYQFVVGGKDGWVVKPSENYNQWAGRMRFQVNDTLLFKYKSGADSVVVVNKDDYDKCNSANPITKLDDGNSIFKLDRSGPFYFISGNKPNCDQGQKLIVVVLAIRTPPSPPSPPLVSSPTASPPQGSSPSISPPVPEPAASPAFSPSPSTGATAPATSPPSPSPGSVSPSPAGASPEPSSSSTTPGSPNSSTPGSPGSTPGSTTPGSPGSTPGSTTPADSNASPSQPRSLAAPPCRSCVFLMSAASVVVSVGLGVFV